MKVLNVLPGGFRSDQSFCRRSACAATAAEKHSIPRPARPQRPCPRHQPGGRHPAGGGGRSHQQGLDGVAEPAPHLHCRYTKLCTSKYPPLPFGIGTGETPVQYWQGSSNPFLSFSLQKNEDHLLSPFQKPKQKRHRCRNPNKIDINTLTGEERVPVVNRRNGKKVRAQLSGGNSHSVDAGLFQGRD